MTEKPEEGAEKKVKKIEEPDPVIEKLEAVPEIEGAEAVPEIEVLVAEEPEAVKKAVARLPRGEPEEVVEVWIPKTAIGKRVLSGEITDIGEILRAGTPIMEAGLVDKLLPELQEEVVDVRRVQRMLDSGRRMRFSVMVVIGDKKGHVGVGLSKGVEAGPTIRKAIIRGKLNIMEVKRGCASWECGCGEPHTVPMRVTGKKGSVKITLKPAPRGVGIVAGANARKILELAGIEDVWVYSNGHTRTAINQVLAIFDAFKRINRFKTGEAKAKTENG
jgi:small subunit ribosomal protein S5